MKNYYARVIALAEYILENKSTIRKTAQHFGMAKSTVHYDLELRLYYADSDLFFKVKKLLQQNFSEKHLRGGEATRKKYLLFK